MATARSPRRAANGTPGRIPLFLVAMMFAVSISSVQVVQAPPPIPMTTQGAAYGRSGSPLPAGTPIRTFIDGVDYSNHSVVLDAAGSYSVLTQGNLLINSTTPEPSPTKHGANVGEEVLYAASDFTSSADVFQETVAWHPDLVVSQRLDLGSAATTPEPLKIQGLVTQPAQGGTPYVYLCNPTAAPVSLSDYFLQRDAPGTYFGGNLTLAGAIAPGGIVREDLTSAFVLVPSGDALKIVYRNPGGAAASAGGADFVVDRVEFNATVGGTLFWQPGSTTMGSAPAPGAGQILERLASCADSNSPSDFHLAAEPGIPVAAPPVVTITSPGAGQNVQGGQSFTIRWTMTDTVFVNSYLRVWVNVSYKGVTTSLLAGAFGVTAVDWNVPDVDAPGSTVTIQVTDPFGGQGNARTTFNLTPATPYSAYVAVLIIVVIATFILWAYRHARREAERTRAQTKPPEAPLKPATAGPPPATGTGPPAAGQKICPQCQSSVNEADLTCFYCGHAFVPPP